MGVKVNSVKWEGEGRTQVACGGEVSGEECEVLLVGGCEDGRVVGRVSEGLSTSLTPGAVKEEEEGEGAGGSELGLDGNLEAPAQLRDSRSTTVSHVQPADHSLTLKKQACANQAISELFGFSYLSPSFSLRFPSQPSHDRSSRPTLPLLPPA